jgi:hypothetical protein
MVAVRNLQRWQVGDRRQEGAAGATGCNGLMSPAGRRRDMRETAVLAALAVALAGCAGAPAGPGDAGREGTLAPPAPPAPSVESFGFTLGAAAGSPVGGAILPVDDGRRTPFEVAEGYTLLEATATWECDPGALCELDLELRRGEQELVTSGFGASPVTLTVEEPGEGRWTFWAFPSSQGSVVVGVQGTLTVSLS